MPKNPHNITRAKQRENKRQARYFSDDIEQPFDERGRRSARFERIYGNKLKLYGNK